MSKKKKAQSRTSGTRLLSRAIQAVTDEVEDLASWLGLIKFFVPVVLGLLYVYSSSMGPNWNGLDADARESSDDLKAVRGRFTEFKDSVSASVSRYRILAAAEKDKQSRQLTELLDAEDVSIDARSAARLQSEHDSYAALEKALLTHVAQLRDVRAWCIAQKQGTLAVDELSGKATELLQAAAAERAKYVERLKK
ncbi:MAG: hypothetical protein AAF581_15960 [Planctomycetota bacterium]